MRMTLASELLHSSILFWMAWVIIPIIMEIIPTIVNFFVLLKRKLWSIRSRQKNRKQAGGDEQEIQDESGIVLEYFPEITLIIPVYNSADSLYACIKSVNDSTYDSRMIHIMLVNNKSRDESFEVFCQCQKEFPELTINWLNSEQGKSKALNLALFNSHGKYIIHIDSDGVLHPDALYRMVYQFETEKDVDCLTGTIMTNPKMIDETKGFFKRLFRKLEFFEYCQAFLAGRNFQSEFNSIFTLSGAFSAFRKSAILKTQLYNTDTVCEDTHVTFQIRDTLRERVALCDGAYFFVDPIEDLNRLYIQRQRWQRGEIEVMHMFMKKRMKAATGFLTDFIIRLIMYDHTFAFPRMIWYFAIICLAFINYPIRLIIYSVIIMYLLYVLATLLLYLSIILFLSKEKTLRRYYARKWYLIFLLPLYNFMVFWFRFAGIINSIKGEQSWRVKNLTEEKEDFWSIVKKDFCWLLVLLERWKSEVNTDE